MQQRTEKNQREKNDLKLLSIDIKRIHSEKEPTYDDSEVVMLADSINKLGIINPITVRIRKSKDEKPLVSSDIVKKMTEDHEYELIIGEKRLRAMKILGKDTIPCIITCASDSECILIKLADSQTKKDLNMFEFARLVEKLTSEHKMKQDEIASRLSTSQSNIANKLRLLRFTEEERKLFIDSAIGERHARAILRIKDEKLRKNIVQKVCGEKLSLKETEALVDELTECDSLAQSGERRIEKLYKEAMDAVNVYFADEGLSSVEKIENDKEIRITIRLFKKNQKRFT